MTLRVICVRLTHIPWLPSQNCLTSIISQHLPTAELCWTVLGSLDKGKRSRGGCWLKTVVFGGVCAHENRRATKNVDPNG